MDYKQKYSFGFGILISVIVALFFIGMLVIVFIFIGSEINETTSIPQSGTNFETLFFTDAGTPLLVAGQPDLILSNVSIVNGIDTVPESNYSIINGVLIADSKIEYKVYVLYQEYANETSNIAPYHYANYTTPRWAYSVNWNTYWRNVNLTIVNRTDVIPTDCFKDKVSIRFYMTSNGNAVKTMCYNGTLWETVYLAGLSAPISCSGTDANPNLVFDGIYPTGSGYGFWTWNSGYPSSSWNQCTPTYDVGFGEEAFYWNMNETRGFNGTYVNITYDYSYNEQTEAGKVAMDSGTGIAGVTNWFPIIITFVVVIILIILAIVILQMFKKGAIGEGTA